MRYKSFVAAFAQQEHNVKFLPLRNIPASVASVVCCEGIEIDLDEDVAKKLEADGLGSIQPLPKAKPRVKNKTSDKGSESKHEPKKSGDLLDGNLS